MERGLLSRGDSDKSVRASAPGGVSPSKALWVRFEAPDLPVPPPTARGQSRQRRGRRSSEWGGNTRLVKCFF